MFISSLRYSIYKVQPLAAANFDIIAEVVRFVKSFFLFFSNFFSLAALPAGRSSDSLHILAQGFHFVKHEFQFFEINIPAEYWKKFAEKWKKVLDKWKVLC